MLRGILLDKMIKEKIIVIVSFIVFGIMVVSASPFYYNFGLDYDKGKIDIKSVNIEFYQDSNLIWNYFNDSNSYYLEIVDNKKEVLDKTFFSPPNFVIYDLVDENGNFSESLLVEFENVSFGVFVDYYENAHKNNSHSAVPGADTGSCDHHRSRETTICRRP